MLVYPKDKWTSQESAKVVYKILCKYCPKVYTGETGRRFGAMEKYDKKDVASLMDMKIHQIHNERLCVRVSFLSTH